MCVPNTVVGPLSPCPITRLTTTVPLAGILMVPKSASSSSFLNVTSVAEVCHQR